jgi:hypothetical protein
MLAASDFLNTVPWDRISQLNRSKYMVKSNEAQNDGVGLIGGRR